MNNLSKRLLSIVVTCTVILSTMPAGAVYAVDKSKTVLALGNAHIDAAWNWRFGETVQEVNTTFKRALDLMDANPNYHYTQSASKYYQWAQEYYPELIPRLNEKIKNGQWEIVGGQEIEPDLNVPSGESLVRQSLYAQRYFQKTFNVTPKVGWVPDVFGFNYNMPQILKKSGMDYFLTTKLNWNDTNKFPYEIFNWQGPDGSQVLTYKPTNDYSISGSSLNNTSITNMMTQPAALGLDYAITLYGSGDHGGGPVPTDITALNTANTTTGVPSVKMDSAIDAFNTINQNVKDKGVTLPKVDDELYLENHRGIGTSAGPMKKYNRESEVKAEETEKLSSIATILGSVAYPAAKITASWDKTNLNQFHDVLPGSAITDVYEKDAFNDAEIALNELNSSIDNATRAINSRINTIGTGTPVVLQNTLSWDRTSIAQSVVDVSGPKAVVGIFDVNGKEVPSQVISRVGNKLTVSYEATVPAMGYAVYRAVEEATPVATTNLVVDPASKTMENKNLKVVIDGATGNISSIHDKINNKEVFVTGTQGNELQVLVDTPKDWDAWNVDGDDMRATPTLITPTSIELVDNGPVKATYRIKKTYGTSPITQDITLYANSDKVDVKVSTDWHETQKMLKVAFPMSVNNSNATYEIAYAAIDRTTDINSSKFEVDGHKWADLTATDKSYGVSILNDCKYGWNCFGNVLRLSLIKSAADRGGNTDRSHQEINYAIAPHAGDWKTGDTVLKADDLNYPLLSQTTTAHDGDLASNASFGKVTSADKNVIMTVLKKAEDSDDYVVRMYESEGKDGSTATVSLPATVTDVTETNLLELPIAGAVKPAISGKTFTTTLGKYEIKTFLVKLNNSAIFKDQKPVTTNIDLSSSYNIDGISSDANRADGDFTGAGETFSAELMPATVVSEGVKFNMGPKADGKANFVKATGQNITLPTGQHKLLYILGAGTPGVTSGDIKVNYSDNTSTSKPFSFTGWQEPIGSYLKTYVKETIGLNLSHTHTPTGNTYDVNNNLFIYKMALDPSKTLATVSLPNAAGMKIAAMSFVDGISTENMDTQSPAAVQNLAITTPNKYYSPYANLSWDAATDNVGVADYIIYRATKEDLSDLAVIGRSDTNTYKDSAFNSIAKYYYLVKAEDDQGNVGPASNIKNTYAGANIAVGMTATADSSTGAAEAAQMAIDGNYSTKWCANTSTTHWLMVDLGKVKNINGFKTFHASAGGEDASWNTKAYTISVSDDNKTWTTPVTVTGNTAAITEDLVKTSGRYVKLTTTTPTNSTDPASRIYEFQIYGDDADFPTAVPTIVPVIKSITQKNLTAIVDFDNTTDADSYIINYGTKPGKYDSKIINVKLGPVVIDPVVSGNTYYFTITPVNVLGQGGTSAEQSIKILNPTLKNVDISSYYNLDGIASLSQNPTDGNFDGGGGAGTFDADVMPQTFNIQNFSFTLGSMKDGNKNVFKCDGSTIALPQEKTTDLYLLETATMGKQTGNFTVNYVDGTSSTSSVSMTDWCSSSVSSPESFALKMNHRIYNGVSQTINVNLYLNSIKVDGTKTIKSLTVPNNSNMKLCALTLMSYVEPIVQTVAAGITTVTAPAQDATKLTLPSVPEGYTIAIKSTTTGAAIALDGTITPPATDTNVDLVFTVTKTADGTTADTVSIKVLVPAKTKSSGDERNLRGKSIDSDVNAIGGVQNVLTWDPSVNQGVTYNVLRANTLTTGSAIRINEAPLVATSFIDIAVIPKAIYYYSVATIDGDKITTSAAISVVTAEDQSSPVPVTPEAPSITRNDTTNKVTGMTAGMEYKLDNADYVAYDATIFNALDLSGAHTLLVRIAANGINPASDVVTLIFTADNITPPFSGWSGGGSGSSTGTVVLAVTTKTDSNSNVIATIDSSNIGVNNDNVIKVDQPTAGSKLEVQIPASAIGTGTGSFEINTNVATLSFPTSIVDASLLSSGGTLRVSESLMSATEAKTLLVKVPAGSKTNGKVFSFSMSAYDSNNKLVSDIHNFASGKNVSVTIKLSKEDISSMDTSKISSYYFDSTSNSWVDVAGSFDAENMTYTFNTTHLTDFTIMQKATSNVIRLSGINRIETSLAIAKEQYTEKKPDAVVLATANDFADALAGSGLAYKYNAPLLLVNKTASESQAVMDYITANLSKDKSIYILGETGVVSKEISDYLTSQGYTITRLGGKDRYETNQKIIDNLNVVKGTSLVIATGNGFADALSISSIADIKGFPVLLNDKDNLSASASNYITSLAPTTIYLVGGTGVLSINIENQIKKLNGNIAIVRLGGNDRYETSMKIVDYFNLSTTNIAVATGVDFPDALSGAVLAARKNSAVLLLDNKDAIKQKELLSKEKITDITVFGGESVISGDTLTSLLQK